VLRVSGYAGEEFRGRVTRVSPAANATTRQIEVLVEFTGGRQPKLAGLYAEGYVETESQSAFAVPASALVREGDKAYAWRLEGGVLKRVSIVVGERDSRSGDWVVKSGLAAGDRLLRYPGANLKDGQAFETNGAAKAAGG